MKYEHGTHELDEEVILNDITYQINGEYTNVLDHEETDGRSNVIVSEDAIIFEVESVFFGDDFEITLKDQQILNELESELYNLL